MNINIGSSNQINKNIDVIQKTYELYANMDTTPKAPVKTETQPADNNFNDAYSNFRNSIQKARESLTNNETISSAQLNPKLQESVKKLAALNQKTQVDKVNNISEVNKEYALSINDTVAKTKEQLKELSNKIQNLKVNKDISFMNENVASSWVNSIR